MKIVYFSHALTSCWNHGNAHFQRGVLRALMAAGHAVCAYEPEQSWSRDNLVQSQGEAALHEFVRYFSDLTVRRYHHASDLPEALSDADAVIVHEWTDPAIVAAIGRVRAAGGRFTLLFHDTHHRAVSDPEAMRCFDLSAYDAVLAFGATLAHVYERWGWKDRVLVWHEAADTTLFHPPAIAASRQGAVWIGNFGDGERTAELETYLLRPIALAGITLDMYGVRYPEEATAMLRNVGARYHGWIGNAQAPSVFVRHAMTVHVPRRYYTTLLPGIPTIRVFEALACGIPLICAPWDDCENLFRPGEDYLVAHSTGDMVRHMKAITQDPALAAALAASGLSRIQARHNCNVRAAELLEFLAKFAQIPVRAQGAAS